MTDRIRFTILRDSGGDGKLKPWCPVCNEFYLSQLGHYPCSDFFHDCEDYKECLIIEDLTEEEGNEKS